MKARERESACICKVLSVDIRISHLLFLTTLIVTHFLCPLIHKLQFYFYVAFIIIYGY